MKIRPIVCFCSDSTCFHLECPNALYDFYPGCWSFYFHSLIKSTFLVSKRLLCLYDEQNNTWLLVDMKFLFSCSTRHLNRSLRSLVGYREEKFHIYAPMYYSIYKTIGSKYSLSCWDLILTRNSLSITDISEFLCRHLETRIRLLLTANLIEIPKWRRHRKRRTRHVNTPWCYSSLGLSHWVAITAF